LIALPYPEQLQRKRERLVNSFANYSTLANAKISQICASPRELGYRGRVKLVVRKTGAEVAAGLYLPGTHRVMDISSCPVHPRAVNSVVHFLKRTIAEFRIAPYDERNDTGQLRYLDLRYSFLNREVSVTLVTRHAAFAEGKPLARRIKQRFPFVSGVIQNINPGRGNVIWGAEYRILIGRDSVVEKFGELDLEFPANVFSQTNPFTAGKLYQKIVELAALKGHEAVVDLYCGGGPIALYLARRARLVWGIDDSPPSIVAAEHNARRNRTVNCRFFAGDVAGKALEAKQQLSNIDLIVLNPPRKGIQPAALEAILAARSPKIIYVSCDPKTLARDLDRFVWAGYALRAVEPFDMFPQTEEVETMALLTKRY
jgi:23S rRNA (uracil-5-)-methyltransferase RumA